MAKVIVNRTGDEKLDMAIEQLKKQFGFKSATKAVEKAIFFMVNDVPRKNKLINELRVKLKESNYLLSRFMEQVDRKEEAKNSISELKEIYKNRIA